MPFFISILEGPSPSRADPIIAISDPILVEIIGEEISKRMAGGQEGKEAEVSRQVRMRSAIRADRPAKGDLYGRC